MPTNPNQDTGASVPDQALVNEAPAGLHPTGFDPSRFPPQRTSHELCIGIVNPYGMLWTDEAFKGCDEAEKHLRDWWGPQADKMTKGFKLCMVRVDVIPESEPFDLPSAIAIEAASAGETAKHGSTEGKSAAPQGIAHD